MLPFDLRMLMLKARLGWSNASFNDLLCLLGSLLPKGNKVPTNTYRAKKIDQTSDVGGGQKIHACPNSCTLFRGTQYENLKCCTNYDAGFKRNASCLMDANDKGASSE